MVTPSSWTAWCGLGGGSHALGRRRSSTRVTALRRAQQAKAGRDAERALRERQIEIALADYFEAVATADEVRADARRKADGLIEAAGQAAAAPEATAREAVRRLRELTSSHGEVAVLCGITIAAVREMLTTAEVTHEHRETGPVPAPAVPGDGS